MRFITIYFLLGFVTPVSIRSDFVRHPAKRGEKTCARTYAIRHHFCHSVCNKRKAWTQLAVCISLSVLWLQFMQHSISLRFFHTFFYVYYKILIEIPRQFRTFFLLCHVSVYARILCSVMCFAAAFCSCKNAHFVCRKSFILKRHCNFFFSPSLSFSLFIPVDLPQYSANWVVSFRRSIFSCLSVFLWVLKCSISNEQCQN